MLENLNLLYQILQQVNKGQIYRRKSPNMIKLKYQELTFLTLKGFFHVTGNNTTD